ncbi:MULTISPECIES: glucosamine-6-phosphate deaminase [Mesobacillus]|uniref:Glucosamine-6-phosphate deaminase n=2 Tax=Mesobacillus TaxID=2675231 RepID=A0A0D6ZCI5_9BACI|nr:MULTISPECIES: glucosamine-6-phosphate deaminase [Mesobacillus]KIY22761.1 glucosamine-6-phosphate deaminase [Mesobacillus subterraneus]MDQ0415628.1 glucosamine-6-phosphate deaminase [Mesobacillus stamsii]
MKMITAKDYSNMSEKAAAYLLDKIKQAPDLTLGLATGGTPIETYKCLVQDHKKNNTTYQHITTFNLDEYIGVKAEDPNSYYHYMKEHLFDHVDIPKQQINIPNGMASDLEQECKEYEQKIADRGGIDLQLLGLGSNGHIGFNEPGTAFDSTTHVIELTQATREANARFFDKMEEVPKQAITMGIANIMKSREILLIVSGEKKSKALDRLLNGEIDPSFPASILKKHPNVTIIADEAVLKHTRVPSTFLQ